MRQLRDGWTLRLPEENDAQEILNLLNDQSRVLCGETQASPGMVRAKLASPTLDLSRNARMLLEGANRIRGLACVVGQASRIRP